MDTSFFLIFAAAALVFFAILVGHISARTGVPLLLIFLVLGMLAGEDGPGRFPFENFELAYVLGSVALAIILFDGGLRTKLTSIRLVWRPSLVLATFGVFITAAVVAYGTMWLLDVPLFEAWLLGAIVASTDAAAVFLLLERRGLRLPPSLSETVEVESGINDPMAIFLTLLFTGILQNQGQQLSLLLLKDLTLQFGLGALTGLGAGWLISFLVARLKLSSSLNPILALSGALAVFAGTQYLGGSGFLAIYLCGIFIGNRTTEGSPHVIAFHSGLAWLSQIVLFLMLGLLVTPRHLPHEVVPALIIAAILMFAARPVAVFLCLIPFRYSVRERLFVSWVGLRGAVPIFLAIIPALTFDHTSIDYFNEVFIVVLASLTLQGWTLPWIARILRLDSSRPSSA